MGGQVYGVGLISDTHGVWRPEICDLFSGVDLIVHAGDVGGPAILAALRDIAPVQAVWGNVDDAHDLAQEVLVKVYQVLDRYDPTFKFSTWLFRVAQNAAIDQIRRRRLKLVSLRQEDDEGDGRDWDLPSPERGPYGEMRNRERGDAIQEAIEALPWEYRELILLRHFGELPYEEIAKMKRMPLGTVKNKLFRGRQMLKEKLQDFLSD
jgi:RNA polymerase sigma-70 factor (ECF subfamily)